MTSFYESHTKKTFLEKNIFFVFFPGIFYLLSSSLHPRPLKNLHLTDLTFSLDEELCEEVWVRSPATADANSSAEVGRLRTGGAKRFLLPV